MLQIKIQTGFSSYSRAVILKVVNGSLVALSGDPEGQNYF